MSSEAMTKVEWALRLAEMGFRVFPLRPNTKNPLHGSRWKMSMTQDPDQIREWFEEEPDANYAGVPDEGHAVVDLDVKGELDGIKVFAELESEQDLDDMVQGATFEVETPSGGRHLYFTVPYPVGCGNTFSDDIDLRGCTGYVVGPGCELDGKPYRVVRDVPIVSAPDWVLGYMKRPGERDERAEVPMFELDTETNVRRAQQFLAQRPGAVTGASGDNYTYATVAAVRDFGVSEEMCLQLMLEPGGWNDRCNPSWTPFGWDNKESLERKVHNGYMYGQNVAGVRGGTPEELFGDSAEQGVEPVLVMKIVGLLAHFFRAPRTSLLLRKAEKEMIVPEWFPAHGLTALLSRRGGGKTVIMVDWALRLAHDMDWHGHPMREGMVAVYMCGEDDVGATEQVRAWLKKYEKKELPPRFAFFDTVPDLLSADSVREWAEFLREQVAPPERCVLFLDTWQRATSRGGQNKDDEMQTAVHHLEVLARTVNGPVMAAFHPPKGKGSEHTILGASTTENATVAMLGIDVEAHGRKLKVLRMKGKGEDNYIMFDFLELGIGLYDDFGLERTGIVPVMIGAMGSAALINQTQAQREGLAHLIYVLDQERHGKAEPAPAQFFLNEFYKMVEEVGPRATAAREKLDEEWTTDEEWAVAATRILIERGGVKAWSATTIGKLVKKCFIDDPRGPWDYHDDKGTTMEVCGTEGRGGRQWFQFNKSLPSDEGDDDDG